VSGPAEQPGETGTVFALGLTIPAERFVTVSLEKDFLVTGDGCEFLSTARLTAICLEGSWRSSEPSDMSLAHGRADRAVAGRIPAARSNPRIGVRGVMVERALVVSW
jgi:hypothetical protein